MAGGPAGGGQGGLANSYPSRTYPEYGDPFYHWEPDPWVGGARGPSALPSRLDPVTPAADGPAPSDPRIRRDRTSSTLSGWKEDTLTIDGTGAQGPISFHRGGYIEDAGAPRLCFDNVFGHGTVPWNRPVYPNQAGAQMFRAPTQQPSWSANTALQQDRPTVPFPIQRKQIANFTVRRPFGDTSSGELFRNGSLAEFVQSIGAGMNLQGRRWLRQSKTHNPTLVNRASYATAGSYGQTTTTLQSQPTNVPDPYGAY
jgi:hypothetical protein